MAWRVTEISKRKETGLKAKFLRESVNLNWDFKRDEDFAPITFHGRGYFMQLNLFNVLLMRYTNISKRLYTGVSRGQKLHTKL